MTIEHIQPSALFSSLEFGFSQVVTSTGKKTIFIAGQTAWDKDMNVVGVGDLGAQMRQTYKNIDYALQEVGATRSDIVRVKNYFVNYSPDLLPVMGEATSEFFAGMKPPAATLLGVQALAMPEFLVEIEVTAVIDA